MKLYRSLFMVVITTMLVSGCALQKDLYSVESRQAQLERRALRIEEQVGNAEKIKAEINKTIEQRDSGGRKLRSQYAAIKAEVDQIRDEVNRLRGSIEEAQFSRSRQPSDSERIDKKTSDKVSVLSQDLEQTKKRLTQLELYLDLDAAEANIDSSDSNDVKADQAIYSAAKAHFDQGRMDKARDGFLKLIQSYPKSANADNAQFWIGETYFQQKWYEKSILEYQKVIEKYPKGNKVSAALLKQAIAFQKIGDKSNAKLILNELTQKYPSSNEGKIATQKLKEL